MDWESEFVEFLKERRLYVNELVKTAEGGEEIMCAIFEFLDYGKKISRKMLTKLLREISITAELRGTDATGISYVNNGKIVMFKKVKAPTRLSFISRKKQQL